MRTKILFFILTAAILFSTTGCSKSLFVKKDAEYELVRQTADQLVYNKYYIKDGSSFFISYEAKGITKRLWTLNKDLALVPDLYSNEVVAFKAGKLEEVKKDIVLTRLKDDGFNVGIYDIKAVDSGYRFSASGNTMSGSSAQSLFSSAGADEVTLLTINGKSVFDYELSSAGTLPAFEENEKVSFTCYIGTEYREGTIIADQHLFIQFEEFDFEDPVITKNGYAAYSMPKEAHSGYYLIANGGLFKYHDYEKGQWAEAEDMNIPNYDTEYDVLNARYQQRAIVVDVRTYNVEFTVEISEEDRKNDVKCVLLSPDGDLYDFIYDNENGIASLILAEIPAGRWVLNIYPKNINVAKVNYYSSNTTVDSIHYVKMIENTEPIESAEFDVDFTGTGNMWGTVTDTATGESKIFKVEKGKVSCKWTALKAGIYKIDIYHYVDSSIQGISLYDADTGGKSDIIIIDIDDMKPTPTPTPTTEPIVEIIVDTGDDEDNNIENESDNESDEGLTEGGDDNE